ncbi:hypothetical protein Q75_03055 [Bacillus coahuilensis p1.1.43]|uniref:DUF4129 domain-containing protein n=1 Tax=Bacillus coahuilensis p1.1.43 TaxID=1150625 RepID=A0A147KB75_9BACI|nr:hypothetical protein [Bacillus coahuilensis]KUP08282.1 hypothetical protein Q75_03055 [Bacillus coahuilensis p1.1.43]
MLNEEQAKKELEEILQQKEYTKYYEQNVFDEIWGKLGNWLAEFFEKFGVTINPTGEVATSTVIFVLFIGIAILLILLIIGINRRLRKRRFSETRPIHTDDDMKWSYKRHLEEASYLEENEEWSSAVRHMFLALLLFYHEKTWLEAKVWKTNWDYYDELTSFNLQLAKEFFEAALLFEEVTYGEHQLEKKQYSGFKENIVRNLHHVNDMEGKGGGKSE